MVGDRYDSNLSSKAKEQREMVLALVVGTSQEFVLKRPERLF